MVSFFLTENLGAREATAHVLAPLEHPSGVFQPVLLWWFVSAKPPHPSPPPSSNPPWAPPSGHSPQRPQAVLDVPVPTTHFRLVLSPLWGPSGRACSSFWPPLRLAWHRAGCQVGLGREAELVRGHMRPGPLPSPSGKARPPTGEQTEEAESWGLSTAHQLQPPPPPASCQAGAPRGAPDPHLPPHPGPGDTCSGHRQLWFPV